MPPQSLPFVLGLVLGLVSATPQSGDLTAPNARWMESVRRGAPDEIVNAALEYRRTALDWPVEASPRERFARVLATENLVLRGRRLRKLALAQAPDLRTRHAALAESLDHQLAIDPVQRIVDYRDARYRVEVPPYPALDYRDAFSISLWLRLEGDVGVDQTKLVSHAGVDGGKVTIMLNLGNVLEALLVGDDGAGRLIRWDRELPRGRWCHVCLVYDGPRGIELLLDGVPVPRPDGIAAPPRIVSRPDQVLYLGGLDRILPGSLDEVALYASALTPGEVQALAAGRDVTRGRIGWWPLDDTEGPAANLDRGDRPGAVGDGVVRGVEGSPALPGSRGFRFCREESQWIRAVRGLEASLDSLERAAGARIAVGPPPDPAAVQSALPARTVLLHYVDDPARDLVSVFRVAAGEEISWIPLGSRTGIAGRIAELEGLLRSARTSAETEAAWVRAARETARALWDPCVVPPGSEVRLRLPPLLAGVPFAALVDGNGRYLVEDHAPVRTAAWSPDRGGDGPGPAVAFGNPAYGGFPGYASAPVWLPVGADPVERGFGVTACLTPGRVLHGTHRELRLLQETFADRGTGLLALEWDDAYESSLGKIPGDVRILHFATHAYALARDCLPVTPSDPFLRVGLQLAGIARARPEENRLRDNGLLSASEISRLPLDAVSLVVFSGCATAAGETLAAEGPFGLSAAARVAGAGRTLSTLWNVDDDAMPEAMRVFYAAWLDGASPARALRATHLASLAAAREARGHGHPRHWAALVLEEP